MTTGLAILSRLKAPEETNKHVTPRNRECPARVQKLVGHFTKSFQYDILQSRFYESTYIMIDSWGNLSYSTLMNAPSNFTPLPFATNFRCLFYEVKWQIYLLFNETVGCCATGHPALWGYELHEQDLRFQTTSERPCMERGAMARRKSKSIVSGKGNIWILNGGVAFWSACETLTTQVNLNLHMLVWWQAC